MAEAVAVAGGRAVLEASGRLTLERARAYAETGVDYLAVGALTHPCRSSTSASTSRRQRTDSEMTLLTIDVGNTHTVLGLFDGEEIVEHWRISTDARRTADEWAVLGPDGLLARGGRRHRRHRHLRDRPVGAARAAR